MEVTNRILNDEIASKMDVVDLLTIGNNNVQAFLGVGAKLTYASLHYQSEACVEFLPDRTNHEVFLQFDREVDGCRRLNLHGFSFGNRSPQSWCLFNIFQAFGITLPDDVIYETSNENIIKYNYSIVIDI